MSGCRRNVEIGKLRVLQAEAALLMQRCGSRLQAAHSDATSHARHAVVAWRSALGLASLGSDIDTTAVMAGIQKLLRDETDGVEVLVEPERHALSQQQVDVAQLFQLQDSPENAGQALVLVLACCRDPMWHLLESTGTV